MVTDDSGIEQNREVLVRYVLQIGTSEYILLMKGKAGMFIKDRQELDCSVLDHDNAAASCILWRL